MTTLSKAAAAIVALMMAGAGAAHAQVEESARQAVRDMKAAMQGASDVNFKAKRTATGLLKDFINLEGEAKIVREANKPTHSRVQLRARMPGAQDKVVDLWTDGTTAEWLDTTKNQMLRRPVKDPLAVSEINMTKQIMFEEWADPRAFERELNAESLRIEGVENVRGKMCDKIVAGFPGGRSTIWYIDAVDRLPLKREDVAQGTPQQPSLTIITEMWDYQTGKGVKADAIRLQLPAGFAMDEIKPAVPAPMEIPAAAELGPKAGEAAPAFELKNLKGQDVTLASLKGNVVLLSFFGTWNAPSMRAATEIQSLADSFKDRPVRVLGMACSEPSAEAAKKTIAENRLTFDVFMDCESVSTQYMVQGVPSFCVIDRDGKVAKFFQSYPGKDKIVAAIEGLLSN